MRTFTDTRHKMLDTVLIPNTPEELAKAKRVVTEQAGERYLEILEMLGLAE